MLRNLDERLTYLRNLEARKETVLKNIEAQGKLTDELKKSDRRCADLDRSLRICIVRISKNGVREQ